MTGPLWFAFLFCGGVPLLGIGVGSARLLAPLNEPWQAAQARVAWADMQRRLP